MRFLLALVFLAIVVPVPKALGFTLNSSTNSDFKGWTDPEINFKINTSNCPANVDVVAAFNDAAKMWNGVSTSRLKVGYGGVTTSTTLASPPTVYCETNFQTVTGLDQDFTVGAGAVTSSNSRITTGVLILNVSAGQGNISTADPTLLKIIMAHEIGHVIGLGHADESTALMYYNASAKRTANLSQDDVDGITYLYPRDELNGDQLMGCGLVSSRGDSPMGPSALASMLGFFGVLVAWFTLRRPSVAVSFKAT